METSGPESVNVPQVGPAEAAELIENGAFLLDVREQDEWESGRAPTAHHIPLGDLVARYLEVPLGVRVVVVCRSGGRSGVAAAAFLEQGYDVMNLAGGMQAWERQQLPVLREDGSPGIVT